MYINEKVPLADVFPLTDEAGNDFARRDYSLKANKDYVKRLAESFDKSTLQPDEMPTLVEDGGIYYIVTGNSRIEAMKTLGVKFFRAVIEDMTKEQAVEKKVIEAVIRTNVKKTYEDQELAEFTRQLMLFGDDQYVSEVTGLDVQRASRVRKGAALAGEVVDQMTLDWMEAVGEFADDPEAQAELLACSASDWKWKADTIRSRKRRLAWRADMEEALAAAGIPVTSDTTGMSYKSMVCSPSDIGGADMPEGAVVKFNGDPGTCVWIYAPAEEEQLDLEREAMLRRRDAAKVLWDEARESREAWMAANALTADPAALVRALGPGDEIDVYDCDVISFLDEHEEVEIPMGPAVSIAAYVALTARPWPSYSDEPLPALCRDFCALTDAMEECGYEPPEAEQRLYQMCKEVIEGQEGESDE